MSSVRTSSLNSIRMLASFIFALRNNETSGCQNRKSIYTRVRLFTATFDNNYLPLHTKPVFDYPSVYIKNKTMSMIIHFTTIGNCLYKYNIISSFHCDSSIEILCVKGSKP